MTIREANIRYLTMNGVGLGTFLITPIEFYPNSRHKTANFLFKAISVGDIPEDIDMLTYWYPKHGPIEFIDNFFGVAKAWGEFNFMKEEIEQETDGGKKYKDIIRVWIEGEIWLEL
jgi:hypothetical protein